LDLKQPTGGEEDKFPGSIALELLIPAKAAGVIIGKGGACSIEIRALTGAFVRVNREEVFDGERVCSLMGKPEQVVAAQGEVLSRIARFVSKAPLPVAAQAGILASQ
jgi:hypothetical protein